MAFQQDWSHEYICATEVLSRRRVLFHSFALRGRLEPSATKVCRQGGALKEDNQVFSSFVFLGFHIKKEKKEEGNFPLSLFISRKKERKKERKTFESRKSLTP